MDLQLVGASRWHREFDRALTRLAGDTGVITIVGAAGVGKTLAARHLHARSAVAAAPCRVVDLRRLPPEMVESEVFGYARAGLFQRDGTVPGLAAAAGDGTCIVQGIERLPAEVQERLAPWLAGEAVAPVGTEAPQRFPARIIVELRLPEFPQWRESPVIAPIYELLRRQPLEMAPLARRREDVLPIADYYLGTYAEAWGIGPRRFGADAARLLRRATWRDNVRGVVAAVASTVLGGATETVTASQLPPWLAGRVADVTTLGLDGVALEELVEQKLAHFFDRLGRYEVHDLYGTIRAKVERPLLRLVLKRTGGNQVRAARILGLNRNTLRARCVTLGLK